ncbi:hypothetical protein SDC9_148331 [bioreactor metagenome]|uniref:Uncharacterized protein n=1 Tax=bioreactor metagenome TaxID=1076179 RepID=A0A645EGJ3_9ZZZZ
MQASRNLVRSLVKLSPGVKYGKHDFQRRFFFLFVVIHRNSASIIGNSNGVIFVDGHVYFITISGKCFVNGIVNHLVNKVMKSFFAYVSDIHSRAFANRFQPFKYLNVLRGIITACRFFFFFCHFYPLNISLRIYNLSLSVFWLKNRTNIRKIRRLANRFSFF